MRPAFQVFQNLNHRLKKHCVFAVGISFKNTNQNYEMYFICKAVFLSCITKTLYYSHTRLVEFLVLSDLGAHLLNRKLNHVSLKF